MSRGPLPCGGVHLAELGAALGTLSNHAERLDAWGRHLAGVLLRGGRLLAAGNGGSASQAQHLTSELVGRYRDDRPPFSAIALCAESSAVTAIGNDYGIGEVFARQVRAHGRPGDVLVALSTSGTSPNVLAAAEAAAAAGLTVWALTGRDGSPLGALADDRLCVDSPHTATVQEIHLIAIHMLCAAVDAELDGRGLMGADAVLPRTRRFEPGSGERRADAAVGGTDGDAARRDDARPATGVAAQPSFEHRDGEGSATGVAARPPARPAAREPRDDRIVGEPRRLVVVGDALLDRDLDGRARRLAPDAPVPVVDDLVEHPRPGGAGLAAALAAGMGVDVTLVCALGDDEAGGTVARLLADAGVRVCDLGLDGGTPEKIRVRATGRALVRLDRGGDSTACGEVTADARAALAAADAVLVADYGRGVAAAPSVRAALGALRGEVPIVWDPHPRGPEPVSGVVLATPNAGEADAFAAHARAADPDSRPAPAGNASRDPAPSVAGGDLLSEEAAHVAAAESAPDDGAADLTAAEAHGRVLAARWRAVDVCVTLGARGAVLVGGDGPALAVPARDVAGGDACGAGDCFAATAAVALAAGALPSEAVHAAVRAASAFVAAGGAAGAAHRGFARAPVVDAPEDARALAARVRAAGGTVVATGGCFDLLHAGHVRALQAARALGDALVVCLNSDASVRRLKGPERPLVGEADRAAVLLALECVDAVIVFDEDDPRAVLREVRPHLWAKGGDYAVADLPEARVLAEWGGRPVIVPYVQGRSTTRLIHQARGRQPSPT